MKDRIRFVVQPLPGTQEQLYAKLRGVAEGINRGRESNHSAAAAAGTTTAGGSTPAQGTSAAAATSAQGVAAASSQAAGEKRTFLKSPIY